jgi:hypothetical protein
MLHECYSVSYRTAPFLYIGNSGRTISKADFQTRKGGAEFRRIKLCMKKRKSQIAMRAGYYPNKQ